jgi:hypothetical protein
MSYRSLASKTFTTCLGELTVGRRYYASRDCDCKQVPWDQWAGIPEGHKLTVSARRMVTLAGSGCSFDEASTKVRELCRLEVSDDVIRRVCDQEGEAAMQWLKTAPQSARPMMQAKGEAEFYTDGVQVNTVEGWREMRVSVFAKREPTTPALPAEWADRVLEKPTCRVASAAIANSRLIGATWPRMLEHLGLANTPRLSVLGDGARWIWDEAAKRFKMIQNVEWVVDIYHVSEHINAAAQKMLGVGTAVARAWSTARLEELIEMEGPKFLEHLQAIRATAADDKSREALDGLAGYLSGNKDSLWYKTRLSEGLPIGSGLVEGTCKNMIGKRLKLNNPRWRVGRAEHMAALRCLHYSGLWKPYWESKGLSKVG